MAEHHNVDFARNIQALEALKTELAGSLAEIYQALFKNDSARFLHASADMTITCFLLCKRLGLNYGQLDNQVYDNLQEMLGKSLEKEKLGYARDLEALKDYLELKR